MDEPEDSGVKTVQIKRKFRLGRRIRPSKNSQPTDRHFTRRQQLFVGVVIVLLIGGLLTYRHYNLLSAPDRQCNGRENSQIYKDAAKVMNPGANFELAKVVRRVKTMKNYQRDPSCQLIITQYSLNIYDAKTARQAFDFYAKRDNQLVPALKKFGQPVDAVEKRVEYVEKLAKQFEKNNTNTFKAP